MSSTLMVGGTAQPHSSPHLPRHGVAVWCDRAILGHGVAAVIGRSPQLGRPLWLGDGHRELPQPDQLHQVAVLVAVWGAAGFWPELREQVPRWLATGVSVVLVGGDPAIRDAVEIKHPRLLWCSSHATASELTSVVLAAVAAANTTRTPQDAVAGSGQPRGARPALSVQEQRVLELVTTGLKVSAVARRLDVSPHTVHTYLRRIRRKLADAGTPVASPLELYRAASLWRLVDQPTMASPASSWGADPLGSTG